LRCTWRHQVRNCQILLVQFAVVSVVVRSFRWQKANKPRLVKQCPRQESKIKTWSFEMFLKWHHSSPIFHHLVNFIGRGQSRKLKAWFSWQRNIRINFCGLISCWNTKTTKTLLPVWRLKEKNEISVVLLQIKSGKVGNYWSNLICYNWTENNEKIDCMWRFRMTKHNTCIMLT